MGVQSRGKKTHLDYKKTEKFNDLYTTLVFIITQCDRISHYETNYIYSISAVLDNLYHVGTR